MLDWYLYPKDVAKTIAKNEKVKRKARKLTQRELAGRSGVTLASLKRFEQTGEISLVSLLKIAEVLEEKSAFIELFTTKEYSSIQEVIDERKRTR